MNIELPHRKWYDNMNNMQFKNASNLQYTPPIISTIPFNCSFIDALARGMLAKHHNLKDWVIFLPSEMACDQLKDFFHKNTTHTQYVMPQIRLLGKINNHHDLFSPSKRVDYPHKPPINSTQRIFYLLHLVLAHNSNNTILQSYHLSKAIAHIIDRIQIEEVSQNTFSSVSDLASHRQDMINLLNLILKSWPNILKENDNTDIEEYHRSCLDFTTYTLWKTNTPFVVAGSSGSIPATRRLMQYAKYVVLQGFQANTHPSQYHINELLKVFNVPWHAVQDWHQSMNIQYQPYVSSSRPKNTQNIFWLESKTYIEEAHSIASIMKSASPNHGMMLITPDKRLAESVISFLRADHIIPNTTFHESLLQSEEGILFLLIAEYIVNQTPLNKQALQLHPWIPENFNLQLDIIPKNPTFSTYMHMQKQFCNSLKIQWHNKQLKTLLHQKHDKTIIMNASTYLALLQDMLSAYKAPRLNCTHPYIKIVNPMEARLQKEETVILGALNQDIWDNTQDENPWLNDSLRSSIGLSNVNFRRAFLEHDIQEALHTPRVILSRTINSNTIPSRLFLQMSELFAQNKQKRTIWCMSSKTSSRFSDVRNYVDKVQASPPICARPKRLSVTQCELLLTDPYAFYARYILQLKHADDTNPKEERKRGIYLHQLFNTLWHTPDHLILNCMRNKILSIYSTPIQKAFADVDLKKIAHWFIAIRTINANTHTRKEVKGNVTYKGIVFTAQTDRIDITKNNICIIDYKTGSVPTKQTIYSGKSLQLPMEVFIYQNNGFSGIPKSQPVTACFLHPKKKLYFDENSMNVSIQKTLKQIDSIIDNYYTKKLAFISTRENSLHPAYQHLARLS